MLSTILVLLVAGAEGEPRVTGGYVAPASLPAGTNAIYGFVGAPELGAGYRQGFGAIELDARASFNLFKVSALIEGGVKFAALEADRFRLAPLLMLGLEFNTGATYFDRHNFAFIGLRPKLGANASYAFTETIHGVAQLEVPLSIALTVPGFQLTPLVGAGGEFHLGGGFSIAVTAHIGMDATKEPLGVTQVRPAWAARLGVGYRLF
ncbi:MAG: hypothetical protein DI536_06855 [Archangium gephyra]|uniref:Outer membrane protein beta-barrel domain-containing protein n=1 Tax=Archangium gephyra TaxID=48 RepID=A0A2W5TRL2_9BACT|nr:MAG: hypothetical protein DI536_06855 [Archangium gephyra]